MRRLVMAAIAVSAMAGQADAADWQFVGESQEDIKFYVDASSMRKLPDGQRVGWRKQVFPRLRKNVFPDGHSYAFDELLLRTRWTCQGEDETLNLVFSLNGQVVEKGLVHPTLRINPIVPGTVGEAIEEFVCSLDAYSVK